MKLGKLIARSPVAPYAIAWSLLALGRSWRMKIKGWEKVREIYARGERPIFAFWHGRLLGLGYAFRKRGFAILSSESRDGQLSIKANRFLGFKVIPGSSTRGGPRGLREITRMARTSAGVGITPDGPVGPRQKLQEGILLIAMTTGYPLVPLSFSAKKGLHLSSWDRFFVPMPFTQAVVNVGEPFYVPRKLGKKERAEYAERFEELMNRHIDATDALMGRENPE